MVFFACILQNCTYFSITTVLETDHGLLDTSLVELEAKASDMFFMLTKSLKRTQYSAQFPNQPIYSIKAKNSAISTWKLMLR